MKDAQKVFNGSIGLSDPSVADIIKMVHPKAGESDKDAIYAYLTEARGWESKVENLPEDVKLFEKLKRGEATQIPNIPFRALTNLKLNSAQWLSIALNMPIDTLRQNLNMLATRDVFKTQSAVDQIVGKLSDSEAIRKSKILPYQLFTTFMNVDAELPVEIKNALQDAAEIATENVPDFGRLVLIVDVSGSMTSPITGYRGSTTSKMRCVDVAGLMASCVLRNNKNARVLAVDTSVYNPDLNPRDSIMTNAQKIAKYGGGGTDLSKPLTLLNNENWKSDLIVQVSDNMSWAGGRWNVASEWARFKTRNPKAKMVNIDIQPYPNAQLPDNKDVLNVGGFSDAIWPAIDSFVKVGGNEADFVGFIENSVTL
jgi:60 kDa SS-A/Ro ribonucleoprotein